MAKKTIIGFAGSKQSGKSTAAAYLVEQHGFTRLSFAQPIRNMIGDFLLDLGYSFFFVEDLLTTEKEQVLASIGKSPRQLMQSLGTEWGRQCIDDDVWVNLARRRIAALDDQFVVFDDVRFENEAAMIRELGGLIIHIDRGDLLVSDSHQSEAGIYDHKDDRLINNDYAIADFLAEVDRVVEGFIRG